MEVTLTALPGVLAIAPRVFADERGRFLETFSAERYAAAGIPGPFVQDNVSFSRRGVLRGLHFQEPRPQGKLVFAVAGAVFDVAVDIRRGSPTFARWVGMELSAERGNQLWVPPGFAHGFLVLSEEAGVVYKCTDVYVPAADGGIAWNDPDVAVAWPAPPRVELLSKKDAAAPRLRDAPVLPTYRG